MAIMASKNMIEGVLFPLNRNPLPLALIKDSFKMYFHEMENCFQ